MTTSNYVKNQMVAPSYNSIYSSQLKVVITSSFTSETIEEYIGFWLEKFGITSQIKFALYNQIFQELLNPASLSASNQDGANIILVRFEDWDRDNNYLKLNVDISEKERILADQLCYTLPNRLEIAHINRYETEYLYQEIFLDRVYLKHGITLNDGDCVVDIGANIGLFTLFVEQQCPHATIYAFEPALHAYKKLQSNAKLYCQDAHLFNCGLGAQNKEATFTFYPRSSVFSSFAADTEQDEKAIRAVIVNILQANNSIDRDAVERLADELLADRLERETYTVQLRTLSGIIEEHHIKQIDLLKLDAEKSELAILQGIEDYHWSLIKQIVMEVHDQEGSRLKEVTTLLTEKGFELIVDEESLLEGSGLYNIYATRSVQQENSASETSGQKAAKIEQNVRDLGNALAIAAGRSTNPHFVCACPGSPTAVADPALRALYQRMEDLLASYLDGLSGVYLITTKELTTTYPVVDYYDPYGDKIGQIPYTPTFFCALGTMLARKIYALKSSPYKVIVLDSDETLWKGVCGEDGAMGIEIDAPRRKLQEFMVAQHDAGKLICLCSKNNESDIVEVFELSDMPLKRNHIVAWRVNWKPKSENIKSLAQELKLGLDSFIFIDDNPVECAEVEANCPEVLTLGLPQETDRIPRFLEHIWAFDQVKITESDKQRTALYQQNIQRDRFQKSALTLKDFLAGLDLKIEISEITPQDISRVSQLTQRTNQFNLTTIRRSEGEIQKLCQRGAFECLVVKVSDRFGDYGEVGVIIFEAGADTINADTFLLSCRTLGKGVEHRMLAKLGKIAVSRGLSHVHLYYIPTQKNQPALDFLESVGGKFKEDLGDRWLFKFPVEVAAAVTYNPGVAEQTPTTDAVALNSKSAPSAAPSDTGTRTRTTVLRQIATSLYDPQQILRTIESQKRQTRPELEETFLAPRTPLEQQIADIWVQVLKLERVGVRDDFIKLGGHSLLATQIISRLHKDLSVELSLQRLLETPTVAGLAQSIEALRWATQDLRASIDLAEDSDEEVRI